MAEITRAQIFKYLSGFQLVMALLFYFVQTFHVDTIYHLVFALALIILAGYLYLEDRRYKRDVKIHELPPGIAHALDILSRFLGGLKDAKKNKTTDRPGESGITENSTGASDGLVEFPGTRDAPAGDLG